MNKFLDSTSLSYLAKSFRDDIVATDPLYFGKLEINCPDECDHANMKVSLENSTSTTDLVSVTITVTCNDDAEVTLTCETEHSS